MLVRLFQGTPAHRDAATVLCQAMRTYQLRDLVRRQKHHRGGATRSLRRAVELWLRRREADFEWWQECALRDRRSLRGLYASLHIRPAPFAQQILFEGSLPAEGRLAAFAEIARGCATARAAELITRHRLPFQTVTGALRRITADVLQALISVMTAPQIVNHLEALRRRGALDDPQTQALVRERITLGARDPRLADFKLVHVANALDLPASMVSELKAAAGRRLVARGALSVPTAILVDKSGSMTTAIEVGKQLATLCSTITRAPLHVVAFDSDAFAIEARGSDFAAWEAAFSGICAEGATSIGVAIEHLRRRAQAVEQLIIVSDGEENTAPLFGQSLARYEHQLGPVEVTWIGIGQKTARATLADALTQRGAPVLELWFDGDYYSLPNVVPLLSPGGRLALVEEIVAVPLPTRDDLERLPPGFDRATYEII
jgi:hypothetical protein